MLLCNNAYIFKEESLFGLKTYFVADFPALILKM
jgi:hypothetical protein